MFNGQDEKEVLAKLVEGFTYGYTDVEASLHAGISVDSLYNYCRKNPSFSSRKEALKRSTTMAAKKNIYTEVGAGDVNTSKWQLEHKNSDEYSRQTKTDLTSGGEALPAIINVVTPPTADYTTEEESD